MHYGYVIYGYINNFKKKKILKIFLNIIGKMEN